MTGIEMFLHGLLVNVLASIIIFIYTIYKAYGTSAEEQEQYKAIMETRKEAIELSNSKLKIFMHNLLFFVPAYVAMQCIIYIAYARKHDGIIGVLRGVVAIDTHSFIPLIKIKTVYK